jgi:hypothetical protein
VTCTNRRIEQNSKCSRKGKIHVLWEIIFCTLSNKKRKISEIKKNQNLLEEEMVGAKSMR